MWSQSSPVNCETSKLPRSICVWKRISHRNRTNKHPNPYTDKRKSHALRTDMEYFRHFIYPTSICRCAPWASLHGFSPLYIPLPRYLRFHLVCSRLLVAVVVSSSSSIWAQAGCWMVNNNNISRLWKFACAPDTHDLRVNGTNQNSAQPNVVFFLCVLEFPWGTLIAR